MRPFSWLKKQVLTMMRRPYFRSDIHMVDGKLAIDADWNEHFIFYLDTIGYSGYQDPDLKVSIYIMSNYQDVVKDMDTEGLTDEEEAQ